MYCSKCGQAIGSQTFCPNCGTPTGVPRVPGMPYPYMGGRIARHLRTLGILWIVFAVYMVLHWLLILPLLSGVLNGHAQWFAGPNNFVYPFHFGGWLIHFIAVAVIVRAILSLAVGVALLTRQPWGRIYAIVIAFLTLLKPFLGTILAIYTLWVLLCHNSGVEYDQIVLAGEVGRPAYPGVPPAPPVPPAPGMPSPRI
jgi:hypothetical protein